jgi:hypothetical protein
MPLPVSGMMPQDSQQAAADVLIYTLQAVADKHQHINLQSCIQYRSHPKYGGAHGSGLPAVGAAAAAAAMLPMTTAVILQL